MPWGLLGGLAGTFGSAALGSLGSAAGARLASNFFGGGQEWDVDDAITYAIQGQQHRTHTHEQLEQDYLLPRLNRQRIEAEQNIDLSLGARWAGMEQERAHFGYMSPLQLAHRQEGLDQDLAHSNRLSQQAYANQRAAYPNATTQELLGTGSPLSPSTSGPPQLGPSGMSTGPAFGNRLMSPNMAQDASSAAMLSSQSSQLMQQRQLGLQAAEIGSRGMIAREQAQTSRYVADQQAQTARYVADLQHGVAGHQWHRAQSARMQAQASVMDAQTRKAVGEVDTLLKKNQAAVLEKPWLLKMALVKAGVDNTLTIAITRLFESHGVDILGPDNPRDWTEQQRGKYANAIRILIGILAKGPREIEGFLQIFGLGTPGLSSSDIGSRLQSGSTGLSGAYESLRGGLEGFRSGAKGKGDSFVEWLKEKMHEYRSELDGRRDFDRRKESAGTKLSYPPVFREKKRQRDYPYPPDLGP